MTRRKKAPSGYTIGEAGAALILARFAVLAIDEIDNLGECEYC